jgi:hypothetical protein
MIRVNLFCEDRTGTGLFRVIEKAVQTARSAEGKAPLTFPRRPGTIESNTKLLKQCSKYAWHRFQAAPGWDHIVYVIDAYRLWDVDEIDIDPPPQQSARMSSYLAKLIAKARAVMERRARDTSSDEEWQSISGGFHPHVLVWERESLMLPVSEALGLGPPPPDPQAERHAAGWVSKRHQEYRRGPYEKSVQGPTFLEQIATAHHLRDRVLAHTPSLAAVVDELVALP